MDSWLKHLDFILIDIACLHTAFFLVYWIRFGGENPYIEREWRNIAIVMTLIDLLTMVFGNFLNHIVRRGHLKELEALIKQIIAVELFTAFYLYAIHESAAYSRIVIVFTGIAHLLLALLFRTLWKRWVKKHFLARKRSVLLIGSGSLAKRFADELEADAQSQMNLEAYLADDPCDGIARYGGKAGLLEQFLRNHTIDEVVAALGERENHALVSIVNVCEKHGVRFSMIPYYHDVMSSQACIEQVGKIKLLNFRTTPLDNATNAMIKRLFDIAASLALLVLTSPVMLIAAIGVKLSSSGPVLFRQERVGRNKIPYTMLKFRSMRITGTEATGWSTNHDPRKTKFGSFLRKCSIDELPQLFNVLIGQMSLIGPRPEVPYHVAHFMDEIPMYLVRQQVRPGITGWAQVHGLRGDTSIEERVKYDIWYIENWSFSLDLKIMLKTMFGGMVNSETLKTQESKEA